MALFVVNKGGIVPQGADPFFLAGVGQAEFGVSTATKCTIKVGAQTWVFSGAGFGNFDHGVPTTGTITGIRYTDLKLDIRLSNTSISVEHLMAYAATGKTSALMNELFGGDDTIKGHAKPDTLGGYGGDDVINGGLGNDNLTGGIGADRLEGGDGNDYLFGGQTSPNGSDRYQTGDRINGGAGNDEIRAALGVVDGGEGADFINLFRTGNTDDVVDVKKMASALGVKVGAGLTIRNVEHISFNGGGGDDTLIIYQEDNIPGARVSEFEGGSGIDTLVANLGHLTTAVDFHPPTSSGVVRFAGYDLHGIERFVINTGSGNDTLSGGGKDDIFNTGAGNDVVFAGAGNNIADGGGGDDLLDSFGQGANQFDGGEGNDTLVAYAGADDLDGGSGNDILVGAGGNDTLTGGAGSDSFVFSTAPGDGNIDAISDFVAADDTIRLKVSEFAGLSTGVLAANAFVTGAAASTAEHRIIYNSATGALLFDADGDGDGAQVQFATLSTGLVLGEADFLVVAS